MSDYMLLEYLKGRGKHEDHQLLEDFKQYMHAKGMKGARRHKDYHWDEVDYKRHDWDMEDYDSYPARGYKDSRSMGSFSEMEAKEIVSEMFHYEGANKHYGEHFDMHKAKEVHEKYKHHFSVDASTCDVYVAINAAYHDFSEVLKKWFGSNIDEKVIVLAITFWFKDDDYQGNKLMDYFE